ncbi:ATP-binding protein [Kitasatospora viridis]|uniref:Anti-sigma regulatory factor (Ser/Thr protein kinase) n=1 Tax=Kitasatospora viridis TaxID=281105 RepID=A0A561T6R0_9ACTN|nr:ATP-binding protein [Kitasatospora viridis]TWF82787.1 anti-sigma regulatory factor (Ser/Thr protein kinase) [Kitasatospora viridis]
MPTATLNGWPSTVRLSRTMSCRPEAARVARALVAEALDAWGLDRISADSRLVVSELVGNAVKHTGCVRITVSVERLRCGVRVGVRDASAALPVVLPATVEGEGGRGMGLVQEVAARWGVDRLPFGKVVWAECALKAPDCIPG